MVKMARRVRPLLWVASSKRDYHGFPPRVQDQFGFELFLVQTGQHPPSAKSLKGLGSGTVELVDDFDGDTYRAVASHGPRNLSRCMCWRGSSRAGLGHGGTGNTATRTPTIPSCPSLSPIATSAAEWHSMAILQPSNVVAKLVKLNTFFV
jgi:hypothetical protein